MKLAVGRFDPAAPRHEQPAALAETLFSPVLAYRGDPVSCGFLGLDGGDTLQPAWAQPEPKCAWVLRLHETMGRRGVARLRVAPGWKVTRVDLSGKANTGGSGARVSFRPYEIVSLRFTPAKA